MGWTPPTKFIVILTLITMVFGIFILVDLWFLSPSMLPAFSIGAINVWEIIVLVLFFLTWFLFFLGVKLKGI
ncbi:MAG: hypothetical protein KGD65_07480 [Candidatus Lokiarchaeota archaeon]|nr:hypothetical protein [Candidatus Lokiarchaeota archaeon]